MVRYGRKVCCKFNVNRSCVGLVDGLRICYLDVTTEEEFKMTHNFHFVFCPFMPETVKLACELDFKKIGCSVRRWKE
jgi:hypothetical protein